MKFKSIEQVKESILKYYFEVQNQSELDQKDTEKLDGFLLSYKTETLLQLNYKQLMVLYYMFWQQDQNTDWLSCALGLTRRAATNSANALVRRNLLYWDYPTSSNIEGFINCLSKYYK